MSIKAAKNLILTTQLNEIPNLINFDEFTEYKWEEIENHINDLRDTNAELGVLFDTFIWVLNEYGTEWVNYLSALPKEDRQSVIESMKLKLLGGELEENL